MAFIAPERFSEFLLCQGEPFFELVLYILSCFQAFLELFPVPQLLLEAPGFGHSTLSESLLLGPAISLAFPLPLLLQLCLLGLLCVLFGMSVVAC